MIRKIIILLTIAVPIFSADPALPREQRLEAALERSRVSLGNPVYLNVTFYGSQDIAMPDMPVVAGLRIKYVGPATQVSIINGKISRSITHSYLVISKKEGNFKIGPFFTEYRGETYSAAPVMLAVYGTPSVRPPPVRGPAAPKFTPAEKPYSGDRVFLVMKTPKRTVYINEIIPVTVTLYVDEMRLKEIEYPVFGHEGFSAEEWEEPRKRQETRDGIRYHVLVFRINLFGIKEGTYALGPANLGCKVVVPKRSAGRPSFFGRRSVFDDDFFSDIFKRYEMYPLEVESDPVEMTILPFPEKDRPLDFRGAVGDFSMETHCEPRKVRVGDPLTVRMIITGTGNMDTVTAPEVKDGEDFKIYEPQVTKKERMKTYEQIIIPKTDEMKEIPGISFSFFDPRTGRYKTIEEPPLPVEVAARPESEKAVKIVSMAGKEQMFYPPEKLGQDIIHIKENIGDLREKGGFFYNNIFFWAGQLVPLGFLLAFYAAHRRKEKIRTDRRYARSLEAPAGAKRGIRKAGMCLRKNDAAGFYDAVFRTLQEYLGNKFDMAGGSITAQVVEDKLRPAGCDENVLRQIREVFAGCDMVRYASAIPGGEKAKEVLEKVRKIIDSLERTRL